MVIRLIGAVAELVEFIEAMFELAVFENEGDVRPENQLKKLEDVQVRAADRPGKDAGPATGAPGRCSRNSRKFTGATAAGSPATSAVSANASALKPRKKSAGLKVTLEQILAVDLNDCKTIPEAINKFQLETNITGNRLAELLGLAAPDITAARQGKCFPYIENAFKAKFPGLKI